MKLSQFVEINRPLEAVWNSVIDFRNCSNYIESIISLEVLEEPENTLIGFKWKETRVMFGKEATEVMWITEYTEKEYYQTRAESHGSIYTSRISVAPAGDKTKLTMSFSAEAQTFFAKLMSGIMGPLFKGSMKKAVLKDLNDIKAHLESK